MTFIRMNIADIHRVVKYTSIHNYINLCQEVTKGKPSYASAKSHNTVVILINIATKS